MQHRALHGRARRAVSVAATARVPMGMRAGRRVPRPGNVGGRPLHRAADAQPAPVHPWRSTSKRCSVACRYNCRSVDATSALRFSKNSAKHSIPYVGISGIEWRLRKAASLV